MLALGAWVKANDAVKENMERASAGDNVTCRFFAFMGYRKILSAESPRLTAAFGFGELICLLPKQRRLYLFHGHHH